MIRFYDELVKFNTFKERYDYLCLKGKVGETTFGFDRFLNQTLYRSKRWAKARDEVIMRDNGCDLGLEGYEIQYRIIIHHINPVSVSDIENENPTLFDPRFLICVSHVTHLAIHYGDEKLLPKDSLKRFSGDTKLW